MTMIQGENRCAGTADGEFCRDDYVQVIWQWVIGRNGERDRKIISMYLFDGLTYEKMLDRLQEDGYEIGLDQLKKIISKRKEQVFRHMK